MKDEAEIKDAATPQEIEDNVPDEAEIAAEEIDELSDKQKEIDELKNRLLRAQAEFDNYRKRTRAEMGELRNFVIADVIRKFLPVIDNFKRALETESAQDIDTVKTGMELIYRQIEKAVCDAGAEQIPAIGEQFSPELHEALMNTQNPELPDGQIDMVFEEGYKIADKIIRHSKVRVVNNS